MTSEQWIALQDYIKCLVTEKIEQAFSRDTLHESIQTREAELEVEHLFCKKEE